MPNINALIIGCGNIGGGYDLNQPHKVLTHAKAFSIDSAINFSVYDQDVNKANLIGNTYHAPIINEIIKEEIKKYQIVSITSPTTTHFAILKLLFECETPVIICEKPISNSVKELDELTALYKKGQSKVLVNYIRRFQAGYIELKNFIADIDVAEFKGIVVKYQRGFLNNASHAIDLLEFLFDSPLLLNDLKISNADFDSFDYDPTLSGTCTFLKKPVCFIGLNTADYTIFEIEIFFSQSKIVICHSGDDIRFYKRSDGNQLKEDISLRKVGVLNKYMIPVINKAKSLLKPSEEDNFLSSLEMNKRLLKNIALKN